MKQLILLLTITFMFSCNDSDKKDTETTTKETDSVGKNNTSSGNIKDKEDFMLTCNVDASNALGGENQDKVKQFCECAWEKSKGEYRGEVIANNSKLEKDSVLKSCYDAAKK